MGFRPTRWPRKGVVPVSSLRDTPGPIGACVGDICLLGSGRRRLHHSSAKGCDRPQNRNTERLARHGAAWIGRERPRALDAASAALAQEPALGVEDVDGFCAVVTETNKATWPIPVLPCPSRTITKTWKLASRPTGTVQDWASRRCVPWIAWSASSISRAWTMNQRRRSFDERTAE